jgi:hypothetical protein
MWMCVCLGCGAHLVMEKVLILQMVHAVVQGP